MIDILLYGLLGLAAAALLYNFIRRIARSRSDLGIEGKLIWMDKGRSTKPFFNQVFEVLGKPDLMYRVRGGVLAVEYKSRRGPVFKSDVVQAKCAALAAREKLSVAPSHSVVGAHTRKRLCFESVGFR